MAQKTHLLVLLHGLWGNIGHLAELGRAIKDKHDKSNKEGEELVVFLPKSNENVATYDGIDWGGERVADEVCGRVEELAKEDKVVVKLSITGYSLGGLVARYMLGILATRKFFEDIEPVNFITIATPHIGLLEYRSAVFILMSKFGPKLLSRTGQQFYCQDQWSNEGRPLIEVMADPGKIFFKVLSRFKYLRLYANAIHDLLVPYCTSAIETEDVFAEYINNGIEIEMEEKYECVIKKYISPDTPPPKPTLLSRKWFANMKPRPLLPPAAQFRFPFNIVVYCMLPFVALPALSFVVYRLSADSKASKEKIKKWESDESYKQKLVAIFQDLKDLGHDIEDATSEAINNPEGEPYPIMDAKLHPIITPTQKRIARWLNQLPFQKNLAFFPRVRNSHALIVCKDADRVQPHRQGESVVRHWADHFVF